MLKLATDEGDLVEALLPVDVLPLCEDEARCVILDSMPRTNTRGLVLDAMEPTGGEAPGLGDTEREAPTVGAARAGDAVAHAEPSASG